MEYGIQERGDKMGKDDAIQQRCKEVPIHSSLESQSPYLSYCGTAGKMAENDRCKTNW